MPARISDWHQRHIPPLPLLAAFLLVGLLYMWATPVLEASDEPRHFAFAEFISRHWTLPVQVPGELNPWNQAGSQPPLYYILVAALVAPVDTSDLPELMQPNPHAIQGDPSAVNNKNRFLHDTTGPELSGAALAVYIARLFSLLLACVSVSAVWLAARELGLLTGQNPRRLALLAAGLVAFNPQFLFNSASVNNDNLITLLGSLAIWQMLSLLRNGLTPRRSLLLALLLALASLSKLSGLLLYAPVGLAALWLTQRSRNWMELARLALLAGICWLVIAGPWYARNLTLYGELTGAQTMLDIVGRRPDPSLETMLTDEFRGLRYSYWGIFGGFNIFSPAPFYLAMDVVTLAGVTGLLLWLWQKRNMPDALFLVFLTALCIALFAGALITWTLQTSASTGRLLFPVSAASGTLLALGLGALKLPSRPLVVALGLTAILMPFLSILPAYATPAIVSELPAEATALNLHFDDIELLGYHVQQRRLGPGDTLPVTLYWRPLRHSDLNYSFYLHLLNSVDRVLVRNYGFPGGGSLQTSRWEPGIIYEDRWVLELPEDAGGQTSLRVHIGWWKYPDGYAVPGTDPGGSEVDPVLIPAGAFADGNDVDLMLTQKIEPLLYGNSIRLLAYEREGPDVALLWEVSERPEPNLHVFLHVLDNTAPDEPVVVLAQGDDEPSLPTRYWQPGERFITQHRLQMTAAAIPGEYTLRVGWYSTSRYGRLVADCPDNSCPLATLTLPL